MYAGVSGAVVMIRVCVMATAIISMIRRCAIHGVDGVHVIIIGTAIIANTDTTDTTGITATTATAVTIGGMCHGCYHE